MPGCSVLVCSGHDPSGGAGVDADREAVTAAGAAAVEVVTTRTDQDGRVVRAVRPRPADEWYAEAVELLDGGAVGAVKFGLLACPEGIDAAGRIAARARTLGLPVVVDPVLAASGGERFLDDRGVSRLLEVLIPEGVVLTPNLPECAELAGVAPASLTDDLEARLLAAGCLLKRGARAVVLKGGHGGESPVRDLVMGAGDQPLWLSHPRVAGGGIHGSGCRHASFLAARLALGESLAAAAGGAGGYLAERIAAS